jgi:DNA-binding CsgD family transcriptional regulator
MALASRYAEAHESGVAEIEDAHNYHLEFIEIHALCALAMADIGLRRFASAEAGLDRAETKLRRVDDVHAEMSISTSRMKMGLIRGDDAFLLGEAERVWPRAPSTGMQGDLLAVRGLVYVRKGNYVLARRFASAAERVTRQLEARIMAKCVYAACAVEQATADAQGAVLAAFEAAHTTGAFDPFVITYRAFPDLLRRLVGTPLQEQVGQLIDSTGDHDLGWQTGVIKRALPQLLSRREREVLELLARGLSNRAIAKALWISESTAKVHVRHIFDKLNVRTRTEAALAAHDRALEDASD